MKIYRSPGARGRPRGFDETKALDAAMRCFWALGYEGASVSRLCTKMRMPKASLYAQYGDKAGLFEATVSHYAGTHTASVLSNLTATGDAVAELSAFFDDMISVVTGDPETPGCLIVNVLSEAAGLNARFQALLAEKLKLLEHRIFSTLQAAYPLENIEMQRNKALMLASIARGLAVAARAGHHPDGLRDAAQIAVELSLAPSRAH
jgi:AcrR family transcriptional regulator